jgi:hypothetical protein
MYFLGSKCVSVVSDHATLVHLLKHSSDKLTDRQTHWVDKLMPYANIMRIIYIKGFLDDADPVSRRPDFLPIDDDKLINTQEYLWWDGDVLAILNNDNEPALLALSTEILNVDVEFLAQLKEAYTLCNFSQMRIVYDGRVKRQRNQRTGCLGIIIVWWFPVRHKH